MAVLGVDTFVFVSGALLAYTFLKKSHQKFNVFLYYIHRILRYECGVIVLYKSHNYRLG